MGTKHMGLEEGAADELTKNSLNINRMDRKIKQVKDKYQASLYQTKKD